MVEKTTKYKRSRKAEREMNLFYGSLENGTHRWAKYQSNGSYIKDPILQKLFS